jgi:hypothetical protein
MGFLLVIAVRMPTLAVRENITMSLRGDLFDSAGSISVRGSQSGVTPKCPKCGTVIAPEDVNVSQDVAYCRTCNLAHTLSRLAHAGDAVLSVDPGAPPAGAWQTEHGGETVVAATHRSVGGAIGTLFICLFWNGIVSIFVLLAIGSTLRQLHIPLPHWFPAPDMSGGPMSLGMTIFLWVFLTPFIAIGAGLLGAFLSCVGGRTEVRITNGKGQVFTGIGPLGWRRRFDGAEVEAVRLENQQWRDSDGDRRRKSFVLLNLRNGRTIKFGSMLTEERRRFMAAALRQVLRH